jgi:hypothetical protein
MNTLDHLKANRKVQAVKQIKEEKFWRGYYKRELENILAITHRDGGDYTVTNGIKESIADAKKIISNCVVR